MVTGYFHRSPSHNLELDHSYVRARADPDEVEPHVLEQVYCNDRA